jgi:hypothetical protein
VTVTAFCRPVTALHSVPARLDMHVYIGCVVKRYSARDEVGLSTLAFFRVYAFCLQVGMAQVLIIINLPSLHGSPTRIGYAGRFECAPIKYTHKKHRC